MHLWKAEVLVGTGRAGRVWDIPERVERVGLHIEHCMTYY